MEIPKCPRHRRSVVTRYGWYGRIGQRRQRWRCVSASGQWHTFTEVLPRITAAGADGHRCRECQTELEPWEGQPAPRLYGFAARQIAHALVRVAHGGTYRDVAAEVRAMAGRPLDRSRGRKGGSSGKVALAPANRHGQLVSDWVDTFAEVIWAGYAPESIAPWLMLDDSDFRYSAPGHPRGIRAFTVLAVMEQGPSVPARIVAVEAAKSATLGSWQRTLSRLPPAAWGSGPQVVVGDGGVPLKAAARLWPAPTVLRRCEWHWANNIRDTLPASVRQDPTDEFHARLRGAFTSVAGWEALCTLVWSRRRAATRRSKPGHTYNLTAGALLALDAEVRTALATRATDTGPRSVGPLEQVFTDFANKLGDRAHAMTNKHRADALLKLMAAARNGWADEDAWTDLLTDHLTRRRGHAIEQRKHTAAKTSNSLR